MGKIDKGVKCSIPSCKGEAIRSIAASKVTAAGMKVNTKRRAYLCRTHYKDFKKATRKDRTLEKWRQQGSL
ncbi:MAG: hypothetical protein JSV64_07580 [Candidatus Bathyarchaeota archaeon]|nr:MAG: hypothetical protein JSV64_07580 [Candidatus Bathyarchaeota archaeon]